MAAFHVLSRLLLVALCFIGTTPSLALDPSMIEAARTMPIADMHMHLSRGRSAEFYREQMARNGVRWGGAVGGGPRDDVVAMREALGPHYVAALGQTEFFATFFEGGAAALSDVERPRFKALFETAEREFQTGRVKGFGEIHINNMSPFSPAGTQRKIALESPVVLRMFEIADRHRGFVQIHTMRDSGMDEIKRVAARFARTKIILSHCLPGARPEDVAELLSRTKNVFCELSAKGPVHGPRFFYSGDGIRPEWRKVIVAHADRFMLGTDPCCGLEDRYDEMIAEIRTMLLPDLPPAVMRKVAYENAVRILGLPK